MLQDSPRRSWRSSQANAFLRLLQKFESDYPGLRHNLTAWQLSQGLWRLSQVEWPADEAHETSGGAAERETLRLAARASTLASAKSTSRLSTLTLWHVPVLYTPSMIWESSHLRKKLPFKNSLKFT